MSLIGMAETAAEAETPIGWLRIAWKIAPWAIIAGLVIALLLTRGTLDHVRMQATIDAKNAQLASAQHDLDQANRTTTAVAGYAAKAAALQPIVVQSTHEVDRYAETPAGRAMCDAPDRVRALDALDATLFPPATAGGARAVSADAGASAGGR